MKGRNLAYNIRLMFDVIDYANSKHISEAMLPVNFSKAFDSLR